VYRQLPDGPGKDPYPEAVEQEIQGFAPACVPPRDDGHRQEDLLQAVERLTQSLEQHGMPRMAARVFAFVLADDADRYTASQLADGLRVSNAAISGAVRYLVDTSLLYKERRPGTRADLYRINDEDVWRTIMVAQLSTLHEWDQGLEEALSMLEPGSPGARRLMETREFFTFLRVEMSRIADAWATRRRELFGQENPAAG
jgi:predicted transcriptional regulator